MHVNNYSFIHIGMRRYPKDEVKTLYFNLLNNFFKFETAFNPTKFFCVYY